MKRYPTILPILMAVLVFVAVLRLAWVLPVSQELILPAGLFLLLIIFTTTFGAPLSGGVVTLVPMISAAAFLVTGLTAASWVVFLGAFSSGLIRQRFASHLNLVPAASRLDAFARTAAEATLQTVSLLSAASIYLLLDGELPFTQLNRGSLMAFLAMGLAYLAMSYVMTVLFLTIREASRVNRYVKVLPRILVSEGIPLSFSPLVALTYTILGVAAFLLLSLAIIVASLVMRNLAISRLRLERQLRELDSLQAVGQALATSLDLHAVLGAVYQQVTRIMPAETFYIALADEENDEVFFPLVVENGVGVQWPPQNGGRGLAEHLMGARAHRAEREKTDVLRRTFGLSRSQRPVASWLGVPIQAGDELLGVISVQSHSTYNLYDQTHEEMLTAIASQAALAIQNARLYDRTDQALARRVQELDSILRSVDEGILLLDLSYRIVALNRVLAEYLQIPASTLLRISLLSSTKVEAQALLSGIGFTPEELQSTCRELFRHNADMQRTVITLPGVAPRQVERKLTAVRDRQGAVSGWLLVFRDLTEEIELQELREDMMHMLVHDLRSPLAVLQSSLSSIPGMLDKDRLETVRKLVDLSQRGVNRLLSLVADILDIAKLESGSLPLNPDWIDLQRLMREAAEQIAPLASQSKITIQLSVGELPQRIYLDEALILRVLSNLLDNAVKFSPGGGRIDLWSALDPDQRSKKIWIGVSDHGPGIPEQKRKLIFEKFAQLDGHPGRRTGTGLGLHYCKLAVEAHGGNIWVENRPDQGTTFIIKLPVSCAEKT
jgi:signal transduction histidine kinase